MTEGLNVITVLLGAPAGRIHATLTIPALDHKQEPHDADLPAALPNCAAEISRAAGFVVAKPSAQESVNSW